MKYFIIVLSLLFFLQKNVFAIDKDDATKFVVDIGNQAIKILKIPVDDKEKRKKDLQILLEDKFDMPFIAKLILGKKTYKSLTKEKFNIYSQAFKLHIVNMYSSLLGTYNGQKFTVKNTDIKKKDAYVSSTIAAPDFPTINILWRVREFKDGLKVIDIALEGVSLLRTKRNDFATTLASQGIDGLIIVLKSRNQMPDLRIPGE